MGPAGTRLGLEESARKAESVEPIGCLRLSDVRGVLASPSLRFSPWAISKTTGPMTSIQNQDPAFPGARSSVSSICRTWPMASPQKNKLSATTIAHRKGRLAKAPMQPRIPSVKWPSPLPIGRG